MNLIPLTDSQALDYATAQGDVVTANANLREVVRRLLDAHDVPPTAKFRIDGNVLSVEEAPDA